MNVIGFLTGHLKDIIGGVGGIIDDLNTSGEEKLAAKLKLAELESQFQIRSMEIAQEFAAEQSKIIVAEAQSESYLTRNWRPIAMLAFTYIVVHNYVIVPVFGVHPAEMPPGLWEFLKLGVGGYIGARTVEKVATAVVPVLTSKTP